MNRPLVGDRRRVLEAAADARILASTLGGLYRDLSGALDPASLEQLLTLRSRAYDLANEINRINATAVFASDPPLEPKP